MSKPVATPNKINIYPYGYLTICEGTHSALIGAGILLETDYVPASRQGTVEERGRKITRRANGLLRIHLRPSADASFRRFMQRVMAQ